MSGRFIGAAAALLMAVAIAPAFAQTSQPGSPSNGAVAPSQDQDSGKPARRSRKKAERKTDKEPTAGQMAASERRKKCGAEWREAKAANKVAEGMKWPQYYSQCNARLKGTST